MHNNFVFADEEGCFTFNRNPNVSRFFILCTVTLPECSIASDLLELRRRLAWEDAELGDYFHATTDAQATRDRVYEAILKKPFQIQATIMEKSKAPPQCIVTKPTFYQYGYYFHFKHGIAKKLSAESRTLVTTASLGTKKERIAFETAVESVMRQTSRGEWKSDFKPCQADPCLQVADYCAWAIQRKWKKKGTRSYDLIKDRIDYEYDLWSHGTKHHY